MIKKTITAITAASIALASVPAHASNSVYDWQATIDKHNALIAAGEYSAHRLGKHSNSIFSQVQGPDGYIFGNVINDDVPLPRVRDIKKVIAATKEAGKVVIVASEDWILPSDPVQCEIASQVGMECGDFTVAFMKNTSDLSDAEFEQMLDDQTTMLENIANMFDLTLEDGPSILEKMLIDAGKDIDSYAEAIAEVASLIQDEINLEALEYALNNWDETVASFRAGEIEGHLEAYAGIITAVQDNVDFLESEVARLETELAVAKAEIVRLEGVVSSLENQLAQTQAALAASQTALAEANTALANANSENETLTNTNTNLNNQVANIPNVQGSSYGAGKLVGAKKVASVVASHTGVTIDIADGDTEHNIAWKVAGAVKTALENAASSDNNSSSTTKVIIGSTTYTVNGDVTINTTNATASMGLNGQQATGVVTVTGSAAGFSQADIDAAFASGVQDVKDKTDISLFLYNGTTLLGSEVINKSNTTVADVISANDGSHQGYSAFGTLNIASYLASVITPTINAMNTHIQNGTYESSSIRDHTYTNDDDEEVTVQQVLVKNAAGNSTGTWNTIGELSSSNTLQGIGIVNAIADMTDLMKANYINLKLSGAYSDGYDDGYAEGYDDGFSDGVASVKSASAAYTPSN